MVADYLLCFCRMVRSGKIPYSVVIDLIEKHSDRKSQKSGKLTEDDQSPYIEMAETAA